MSETVTVNYTYDVKSVDRQIRQTNNFLRFLNATRATVEDFKALADDPTLAEFFWALMQLFRTFTALRRLIRSLQLDTRALLHPSEVRTPLVAAPLQQDPRRMVQRMMQSYGLLAVNIDAAINNTPVPIERIDLSNIPDLTVLQLQEIMEEEAPLIVDDAQRILDERIIHRDRSTGRLGRSIRWIPRLPGVTVEAVAPYSFWVEEGHRSFTGHHFLRDATELARPRISAKVSERLNSLIRDGRII
jgi:hypothetical protein